MEFFETRKVVKVFLASPGGVPEEREHSKEIVDNLNVSYRKSGWHIELRRWEEVTPAYGRPQALINPDVNDCDLFVGVLWDRLGSEAGRGKTGFEEEMSLALNRRRKNPKPEISLFVKEVDKARRDDPGPELKKVLDWLEQVITKKKILYKQYKDISEFSLLLYTNINSYMIKLITQSFSPNQLSHANSALPAPPKSTRLALTDQDKAREPGYGQLHDVLMRLSKAVEYAIKPDDSETSSSGENDLSRIHLLSCSMLASRNRAGFMGVHEINLLYHSRKQLRLITAERDYILRTILADAHSSKPGWALFREVDAPLSTAELFDIAALDSDSEVRFGALNILADSEIEFVHDQEPRLSFLQTILSDKALQSRKPAINLASRIGKVEDIPHLDDKLSSSQEESIRGSWLRAKLIILAPVRPEEAFGMVRDHGLTIIEEREICDRLTTHMGSVPSEVLKTALEASGTVAQELATLELLRRGGLTDQDLEALSEAPSSDIKEQVVRERIRRGHSIEFDKLKLDLGVERSLGMEIFCPGSPEDLMKNVSWYTHDRKVAYRTLAFRHFDIWAPYLHRDLGDNFQTYKEDSEKKFMEASKMKYAGNQEVIKLVQEIIDNSNTHQVTSYRKDELAQIALEALAQHPDPGDVEIAKKYLSNSTSFGYGVRLGAAKLLREVGCPSDAKCIFDVLADTYGRTKQELSQYALSLSPGIEGIAEQFLNSGDPDLIEAAVAALVPEDGPPLRSNFKGKLSDPDLRIRQAALSYLAQVCTREELEQLLDEYVTQPSYYYNVVTWLDRLLWAPPPIIDYFRRDLTEAVHKQRS